jgi:hypothetical protein
VPELSPYVEFAQPEMFDVPLLTTGLEHLYVTLNPSPDLTERQLREILYRPSRNAASSAGGLRYPFPRSRARTGRIQRALQGKTLGIGRVDTLTGL